MKRRQSALDSKVWILIYSTAPKTDSVNNSSKKKRQCVQTSLIVKDLLQAKIPNLSTSCQLKP